MGKRTRAEMRAVSARRISPGVPRDKGRKGSAHWPHWPNPKDTDSRYSRLTITLPQQVSTDTIKSERGRDRDYALPVGGWRERDVNIIVWEEKGNKRESKPDIYIAYIPRKIHCSKKLLKHAT